MSVFDMTKHPVHLGLGATAEKCEPFDGTMECTALFITAGEGTLNADAPHDFD